MPSPSHNQVRFADTVNDLLDQHEWSQRDLARVVGVDPAHISRLLRRGGPTVSPQLMVRVAAAFGVRPETFVEYRERLVLEAVRADPTLRESLYLQLQSVAA